MKIAKARRVINTVFLHCSASDNPSHDKVSVMRRWHLNRGFTDVGYHFYIRKDGTIERGRPLAKVPAAQKGHNVGSIAICLGGLKDFTEAQFKALRQLVDGIDAVYPGLRYRGHCEVSNKTCPVYDYRKVLGLDADGHLPEAAPAGEAEALRSIAAQLLTIANRLESGS